jgi:hypothetical protein
MGRIMIEMATLTIQAIRIVEAAAMTANSRRFPMQAAIKAGMTHGVPRKAVL